MMEGIKAVAFDIDGTLYPSISLYIRMAPYFFKHIKFFIKYNKVRKVMHNSAPLGDFFEYQARLLGTEMHVTSERAKDYIEKYCYNGLKYYFNFVKPYKYAYDTICAFKSYGLKIALLSDFPPEQKGSMWGIRSLCDVCIGSEELGALKPSKYPFGVLAESLGVKPEEVLYVGNSIKYDIRGSKAAGMKAAYIMDFWHKLFNIKCKDADISFKNYRQLRNIVLK